MTAVHGMKVFEAMTGGWVAAPDAEAAMEFLRDSEPLAEFGLRSIPVRELSDMEMEDLCFWSDEHQRYQTFREKLEDCMDGAATPLKAFQFTSGSVL